jgi:acetyl esterase/lipase
MNDLQPANDSHKLVKHNKHHYKISYRALIVCLLFIAACVSEIPTPLLPYVIKPSGPKPAWAPNIDPQMQAVIEELDSFGTPPLPKLTPEQARKAPTPTDAVMSLLKEKGIPITPPDLKIDHQVIPGPSPEGILVRTYTPKTGNGPFPVIVYYHGGGWVIADLDTYDPSARALADKTGAIVISVAYRQAPEHKFPAAHNDAFAAYEWALNNAGSINGNPAKVAVAGESAGGNLAAAVSMMAKEKGVKLPVHQLLVYPIANYDFNSPSYKQYADAKPLSKPLMQWFFDKYLNNPAEGNNPLISLVKAPDVSGLPPATVITAQIDPLMSEGKQYADKLKAAGVPVTFQNYEGVTHEFFGMAAVVEQAKKAQSLAATELKKAFQ